MKEPPIINCINLFQPWADAIIAGRLPILIRIFSVEKEIKIGIAATNKFDDIFNNILTEDEKEMAQKYFSFDAALGIVEIKECITIKKKHISKELRNYSGLRNASFYPQHLIPDRPEVYFWILHNPRRFKHPLPILDKGVTHSKVFIHNVKYEVRPNESFWDYFDDKRYLRLNRYFRFARKNESEKS